MPQSDYCYSSTNVGPISPFLTYGGLLVENRQFSLPHLCSIPNLRVFPLHITLGEKLPKYSLSKNLTLGGSTWAPITFCLWPNFTNFFLHHTWEGAPVIRPFSACRYLHPFQRYSRSKCEVAQNRTKFWTVFALPYSKGGSPPKNCTHVIMPPSQHVTSKSLVRLLPLAPKL